MTWPDYLLHEVMFYVLIFIICIAHKNRFDENIPIDARFHFVWGCVYALPVLVVCVLENNYLKLGGILALERFVTYNITLNIFRSRGIFYLGKDKYASTWDTIERSWRDVYPFVWAASVILFIYFQFKL